MTTQPLNEWRCRASGLMTVSEMAEWQVIEADCEVKRVKVSDALLEEMSQGWSNPVQVRIVGADEDGDLEMVFREARSDVATD